MTEENSIENREPAACEGRVDPLVGRLWAACIMIKQYPQRFRLWFVANIQRLVFGAHVADVSNNGIDDVGGFFARQQEERIASVFSQSVRQDRCRSEKDGVLVRSKCLWKIGGRLGVDYREDAITFTSEDGGIEIRVSTELAERHAEITWDEISRRTPCMIATVTSGKTLIPGHIRSYLAANDITLDAELFFQNELRNQRVFSTEPTKVQSTSVEAICRKQVIENRSEFDERVSVLHLFQPNAKGNWDRKSDVEEQRTGE